MQALGSSTSRVKEIWILKGKSSSRINDVLRLASLRKIPVYSKSPEVLAMFMEDVAHQGVVAVAERFDYIDIEELVEITTKNPGEALVIAADHITDEGNLGAIIRTAEFFGANGMVIPKDRSAEVTPRVIKRSSGAGITFPTARVVNMGNSLKRLRKNGFWIIGTSDSARDSIWNFDWKRDVAIVLGNEQKGLGPGIRKYCHEILKIPGYGNIQSLNVAVACGVILSEICRQRKSK